MRKIFIILILAITVGFAQTSEAQVMRRGATILDVGLGVNYAISPFLRIEHGITDKVGPGYFGFGGSAAVSFWSGYTALSIGPEINYHFDFGTFPPRNLDLYIGLGLYYYNWMGYDRAYNPFYPGFHLGMRYFFDGNVGLTLILGGGLSPGAQLGLSLRL
jgi:hypothetical protein